MQRVWLGNLFVVVTGFAVALMATPVSATEARRASELNPIVFVHGGSGSGTQFQSQAQRFTSNGYPQHLLRVVEYDSSSIATILPDVLAQIDAVIAELQESTGRPQIDLVGHSLGTFVSQAYLATPARAANVAHYINVDGRVANALPGGVPTLALFAGAARAVQGQIVGATNVTIPDQEHIEVMTSEESFVEMFTFLTGKPPRTSKIRRSLLARFPVSGRAVIFPQNVGADGALVLVFEVDRRTGERRRNFFSRLAFPEAAFTIDETGEFGPFLARRNTHYEFVLLREGVFKHSFYFEPFLRSDHLVRLNTSIPGEGIDAFIERDDAHAALSISRNKEFRGDRGAQSDILKIEGQNVLTPVNARSGFVGAPAAFFAFDVGSDRIDDLATIPTPFGMLAFLTGADLFIDSSPKNTISIVTVPRGERRNTRFIRVPSRPSTEFRITVQLNDFE